MISLASCKISNELDRSENLICSRWDESGVKFLIIRPGNNLFTGEVSKEIFKDFSEPFEKTFAEYLEEQKEILDGAIESIKFFIEDTLFCWKKKTWTLGRVDIKPTSDVKDLGYFISILISELNNHKKNELELRKDNECLKSDNSKLKKNFEETVKIKTQIEANLYPKFILILNSKKQKIRELKSQIEKLNNIVNSKESIFDVETDNEDELHLSDVNKKRLSTEEENNCEFFKKKVIKMIETTEASTITETVLQNDDFNNQNDDETPDLLLDESECEVELKLEEDKLEDGNQLIKNESEEMFFSDN